jgi:hypothetical protein
MNVALVHKASKDTLPLRRGFRLHCMLIVDHFAVANEHSTRRAGDIRKPQDEGNEFNANIECRMMNFEL